MPSCQFKRSDLELQQGWSRPFIVLPFGEHVPDEHRQLSGGRNSRHLPPTLGADAVKECAEWSWTCRQSPRGLNKHSPSVAASLMGDVSMECGMIARLVNRRIESQVAHQLLRTGEPRDIPDCSQDTCRHHRVHAIDGHEAPDVGVIKCFLRKFTICSGQLATEPLQFVVMPQGRPHLIGRDR